MLTIGLLDDECTSIDVASASIDAILKEKGIQYVIKAFTDPFIFLDSLKDTAYDLVCLDILMPSLSGIEVAKKIRESNHDLSIAFVSSNETKVFSCFEVNPIGFIRKTNFVTDIQSLFRHFFNDILPSKKASSLLKIKVDGETQFISIEKIVYIESNHNYQCIHVVTGETFKIRKNISDMEKELFEYGFVRVHKGFLVNYRFIKKFSNDTIYLLDNQTLPLSQTNRNEIIKRYLDLTRGEIIY